MTVRARCPFCGHQIASGRDAIRHGFLTHSWTGRKIRSTRCDGSVRGIDPAAAIILMVLISVVLAAIIATVVLGVAP